MTEEEEKVEEALQELIKRKPELKKDPKKLKELRKLFRTLIKTDQQLKKEVNKLKKLVEQNSKETTRGYMS